MYYVIISQEKRLVNVDVEWMEHAKFEVARRGIDSKLVDEVVKNPEQKILQGARVVCQKRYFDKALEKEMLLRVIVEIEKSIKIITVYKTSQIERYWKDESSL